jgi:hypothetical protein
METIKVVQAFSFMPYSFYSSYETKLFYFLVFVKKRGMC